MVSGMALQPYLQVLVKCYKVAMSVKCSSPASKASVCKLTLWTHHLDQYIGNIYVCMAWYSHTYNLYNIYCKHCRLLRLAFNSAHGSTMGSYMLMIKNCIMLIHWYYYSMNYLREVVGIATYPNI